MEEYSQILDLSSNEDKNNHTEELFDEIINVDNSKSIYNNSLLSVFHKKSLKNKFEKT